MRPGPVQAVFYSNTDGPAIVPLWSPVPKAVDLLLISVKLPHAWVLGEAVALRNPQTTSRGLYALYWLPLGPPESSMALRNRLREWLEGSRGGDVGKLDNTSPRATCYSSTV